MGCRREGRAGEGWRSIAARTGPTAANRRTERTERRGGERCEGGGKDERKAEEKGDRMAVIFCGDVFWMGWERRRTVESEVKSRRREATGWWRVKRLGIAAALCVPREASC